MQIHERGVNEDLLLVILKAVMQRRPDLKVVLMSATLNADKFAAFFPGAGTVHIPGFTFPVTVKYLDAALVESGVTFTPPEVSYPPPFLGFPATHSWIFKDSHVLPLACVLDVVALCFVRVA